MSESPTEYSGPHESAFDAFEHPGEAANLKVRAALMSRLDDYIREHDLEQVAAAKEFGVDQSRVSQLVNGRISQFTIDALINMCSHAGINVDRIRFDKSPRFWKGRDPKRAAEQAAFTLRGQSGPQMGPQAGPTSSLTSCIGGYQNPNLNAPPIC